MQMDGTDNYDAYLDVCRFFGMASNKHNTVKSALGIHGVFLMMPLATGLGYIISYCDSNRILF